MPSPSGSVISVVEGLQPWKLPATCTPLLSIALFATSHAMFTLKVTSIEHASQELQHTTGNVPYRLAGIVNTRFVYVALPLVQDAVGSFISWIVQLSAEYLNSTVVPCSKGRVTSQTLSPSASAHRVTVTTPVVPCTVHLGRREALGYFVHVHLEGHIRVLRTRDVEDRRVVHRRIRGRTVVESTPWCAVHRGQRGVDRATRLSPHGHKMSTWYQPAFVPSSRPSP